MANHNFIARVGVSHMSQQGVGASSGIWEQLNNDFALSLGGNSYTGTGNSLRCYPHLLLFITRIWWNTLRCF